jgi:tetratricopeptide (TPR) repeat protein
MKESSRLWQFMSIFLIGACFVLSSSGLAQEEQQSAEGSAAAESYNLGIKAEQNGDTVDAVTFYKAAIAADENLADAYFNLGSIYFAQKNYIDAAKNFKQVTERDPSSAEGFANYGKVLFVQKKYSDAMAAYQSALEADPNHAEAEKELGKLYYKQGSKENPEAYDKAIEMLQKYLKNDSTDSYSHYLCAMAYKKRKSYKNAIKNFEKAIKYNANHYESLNGLAGIHLTQQRYSQAIKYYKQALKVKPKNYRCARNLAIAVQSSDPENYDAIIAAWQDFLKIARRNTAASKYVKQAEQLINDLEEAKTVAEEE